MCSTSSPASSFLRGRLILPLVSKNQTSSLIKSTFQQPAQPRQPLFELGQREREGGKGIETNVEGCRGGWVSVVFANTRARVHVAAGHVFTCPTRPFTKTSGFFYGDEKTAKISNFTQPCAWCPGLLAAQNRPRRVATHTTFESVVSGADQAVCCWPMVIINMRVERCGSLGYRTRGALF